MVIDDHFATLRLHGMRRSWQALVETRQHLELNLSDGLEILLQAEDHDRDARRSDRLHKQAAFRYTASLEELSYGTTRGLERNLISQLATGDYISAGHSVMITGASGCGKSCLSCALGYSACSHGFRVSYFNMQKLLTRAKIARAEGQTSKFFDLFRHKDLLIIDDFGLVPQEPQHRVDLMYIIEDRHGKRSTMFTSQVPVDVWHEFIGEQTIADAILDRIVHDAHRLELTGDSLRKRKPKTSENEPLSTT